VEVDLELRNELNDQLRGVIARSQQVPRELSALGVPLTIELRDQALAKSNRPYPLLERAGVEVRASVRRGKLVAPVHDNEVRDLARRIAQEDSPKALYQISAIASFSLWDPVEDAIEIPGAGAPIDKLRAAQASGTPVVIELFPWLAHQLHRGESAIVHYLAQAGLRVEHTSLSGRPALYASVEDPSIDVLRNLVGIRALHESPRYMADQPSESDGESPTFAFPAVTDDPPVVGVLDSGVEAAALGAWLVGADRYVIPRDEDRAHGTFVGGLIADARGLNDGDARLPDDHCRVFDAQVLPAGGVWEYELMNRIEEAVGQRAGSIKVWNCSFSMHGPCPAGGYSKFAAFMDEVARDHDVVFVQAAGNYEGVPARTWPASGHHDDGISSPAEAVDSITVGALTHLEGAITKVGEPASYSRRGPGLDHVIKPDVSHFAGDADVAGSTVATGIQSLAVDGSLRRSVGTSYSTPIVSATTAAVLDSIASADAGAVRSSVLSRALIVHAAKRRSPTIADEDRHYFGHGVPPSAAEVLGDEPSSFTTMYAVEFASSGEWVKRNFPVPACLVNNGVLTGEVLMTVCHDAVIDPNFDGECIRTSVDAQLGPVSFGKRGLPTVSSKVPVESTRRGWETDLIERGKWNPLRTHHKVWTRGTALGGEWGLKLSLLERMERIARPVQVVVVVTFAGLDPSLPVRADGVRALRASGHATQEVASSARLRVRGRS